MIAARREPKQLSSTELVILELSKQPTVKPYMKHLRLAAKEKIDLLVVTSIWQAVVGLGNEQLKRALVNEAAAELVCGQHPFSTANLPFVFADLMICLVRAEADKRGLVSNG